MLLGTQTTAALIVVLAIGSTPVDGWTAESRRLTIATDRRDYFPGETIIVSLVYCTDSTNAAAQSVPPLSPSRGHASLVLIDPSTGLGIRSTAPVPVRTGLPPAEVVASGECGVSLISLIGEFGQPAGEEDPMPKSLGYSSIPSGRYRVKAYLSNWIDGPVSCEFSIGSDSLPALERDAVARFVMGSPGPASTVLAREKYCVQSLEQLANSRYWLFAYSHSGGLADSIPLEQAMEAVSQGEGADARRARVLTRIGRLAPEVRRSIAARYDTSTEGRLVRLVARQIRRQSR